jgi:GT2 family glycosyltransferase
MAHYSFAMPPVNSPDWHTKGWQKGMVSVVIPTYNRAQYIAETIESVLAQTWRQREIIVIDDGSMDNTAAVVSQFGGEVRYIRQPNSERSVARNHGLKLAQGEFIAFLDSDDCWHPGALAAMVETLRRDPALALVTVGCDVVTDNGEVVQRFLPGGGAAGILSGAFPQLLRSNIIGSPSAALLRRRSLDAVGHFEEDPKVIGVEDWELWARLAFHSPLFCLPRQLVRYRRHGTNSPLAGMRLRYGWMVDALLRKLPLSAAEQEQLRRASATRLLDYAGDFFEMRQHDGVRHCLNEAKRIHPGVGNETTFSRLSEGINPSDGVAPSGFTTTLTTRETLEAEAEFQRVYRRIAAYSTS